MYCTLLCLFCFSPFVLTSTSASTLLVSNLIYTLTDIQKGNLSFLYCQTRDLAEFRIVFANAPANPLSHVWMNAQNYYAALVSSSFDRDCEVLVRGKPQMSPNQALRGLRNAVEEHIHRKLTGRMRDEEAVAALPFGAGAAAASSPAPNAEEEEVRRILRQSADLAALQVERCRNRFGRQPSGFPVFGPITLGPRKRDRESGPQDVQIGRAHV